VYAVIQYLNNVVDEAISLTDLIAGNELTPEVEPSPLEEVLAEHFGQDAPTWQDMALIAETVRFLQRREGGDRLAAQVVHWLVEQEEENIKIMLTEEQPDTIIKNENLIFDFFDEGSEVVGHEFTLPGTDQTHHFWFTEELLVTMLERLKAYKAKRASCRG
jgi:hypothetical protein